MHLLSAQWPARLYVALFATLLLVAQGCGGDSQLQKKVLRCAHLQGAKSSKLPELVDEVSRIESSGNGPLQLNRSISPTGQNAATVLSGALTDAQRLRLYADLESLALPADELPSKEELAAMHALLDAEARLLEIIEQAVELPTCVSGARFDLGFFERYTLLDDAAIATRMHLVSAYAAQADGDRTRMFAQTEYAAKWVRWLADEPRLEGRLLAVRLRLEWFELVRSITGRRTTTDELAILFALLRTQLNDWPADRASLVGDRALTLHAYEAIRLGMVDRVITNSEKKLLQDGGWLEKIRSLDAPSLDGDQLIYLRTMDQVIRSSSQPYFERAEELSPLFSELQEGGELARKAPAATRLFLVGVPESLEQMARDRALTEAWMLAIASAAKFDLPPYRINPLNGRPYEAERHGDGVHLKLGDYETPNPFVRAPEVISSR